MSEKKKNWLLIGSVALNIFLVAFVLGRVSMLPPGFPPPGGPMPPFMQAGGGMPPRPPFIMPEMVLSHEEMEKELPFAKERFDKIYALRKQFVADMEKGNLSHAEIVQHFDAIDAVMEELKNHMKETISDKLAKMTPEERKRFIKELMKN
jgi:uncharacterized membrane protein